MESTAAINFYRERDKYGFCLNFYKAPITIDDLDYPTTEHYFQAMKFATTDPDYMERIRKVKGAGEAARLGRSRSHPLRPDWEKVKNDIMRKALHAKFTQHPKLREQLLATVDHHLVEHTTNDRYWGDGGDETGKNMLGKLLVGTHIEQTKLFNFLLSKDVLEMIHANIDYQTFGAF